jgi:hypothetical protein
VTPDEYLDWRSELQASWEKDNRFMSYLEPQLQRDLHACFDFHLPKDDDEALSHLFTLSACEPEAVTYGKAALDELIDAMQGLLDLRSQAVLPLQYDKRRLRVRGVVNPELKSRANRKGGARHGEGEAHEAKGVTIELHKACVSTNNSKNARKLLSRNVGCRIMKPIWTMSGAKKY